MKMVQFDGLDLNTGLVRVVKTLPDETFSSIWVNRDGIRTLFRFVNTLVQFCGGRTRLFGFVSILCLGHWICSCLTFSIPQYSSYSSSLVRYVLRLWNCSQLNKDNSKENTRLPQWPFHIKHKPNTNYPKKSRWKAPPDWLKLQWLE